MFDLSADALSNHLVLDSRNADTARSEIGAKLARHEMELAGDPGAFRAILRRANVHRLTINLVEYGCKVAITPNHFGSFYLLHVNIEGVCDVADQNDTITIDRNQAAFLSPTCNYEFNWQPGCKALAVQIPKSLLHLHARSVLGLELPDRADFDLLLDLHSSEAEGLLGLLEFIIKDLDREHGVSADYTTSSFLESALIDTILKMQLPSARVLAKRQAGLNAATVLPYHVRRATRFMANNISRPVRVSELAEVSGVTTRTLSTNFNQFLGESPSKYFLNMRLDRARTMLQESTEDTRVSDVAHELGFEHQSRFSAAYRERFDELPSETLWRSRGKSSNILI